MATKQDLQEWLVSALKALNGRGTIVDVCKQVWMSHEAELQRSGDLFYTWQYDIRWAATQMRVAGTMRPHDESAKGVWELAK